MRVAAVNQYHKDQAIIGPQTNTLGTDSEWDQAFSKETWKHGAKCCQYAHFLGPSNSILETKPEENNLLGTFKIPTSSSF